jgi:hypothetical protein
MITGSFVSQINSRSVLYIDIVMLAIWSDRHQHIHNNRDSLPVASGNLHVSKEWKRLDACEMLVNFSLLNDASILRHSVGPSKLIRPYRDPK